MTSFFGNRSASLSSRRGGEAASCRGRAPAVGEHRVEDAAPGPPPALSRLCACAGPWGGASLQHVVLPSSTAHQKGFLL